MNECVSWMIQLSVTGVLAGLIIVLGVAIIRRLA